ncbi:DUF2249 domain-containing protein [Mycobacterium sp.]|jgi:uncharacterized protein (DUF2249 family)|uniref:DUF2249 domain-containing protein n=1 Tax=Mycobacterium sp. TaxID=1785 RepID=UPI00263034AE|nr:DUF2249 domain-containing protein [Mycobacterium sp.]
MAANELDVRELRKPDKHPTIFATYAALKVGESFVLVNNHDPKHLREEFEADYQGGYEWEYLEKGPAWRIRIGKLVDIPPPVHHGHEELVLEPPQSAARQEI